MDNRFGDAVALLMKATDHLEKIGGNEGLLRELDAFIRSVHPMECGPFARNVIAEETCQTCMGDPQVCATIPGLRHCEAAMRDTSEGIGK